MNKAKSTSTTSSGDKKRKRTAFYVVKKGRTPGIYMSWDEVTAQVNGFPNSIHQKFDSLTDAEAFFYGVENDGAAKSAKSKQKFKYYAIQGGPGAGVYEDWPSAKKWINGHTGGKPKGFNTEEDALAFVNSSKGTTPAAMSTATSTKGEFDSEASVSDIRKGCKVGDTSAKKQKKTHGASAIRLINEVPLEAGTGPLPEDAEDGFDRTIAFNSVTGIIDYKTEAQLHARKFQPTGDISGPIVVYTDGSSLGNGKVGAMAGVGVYFGANHPNNVSEGLKGDKQTNQRAELTAIQRALDIVPIDKDAIIYSDSNYAIKCVTVWFQNWLRNGWKSSGGETVTNKDIIKPIIDRLEERGFAKAKTNFEWVKGHADNLGNKAADILAVQGARDAMQAQFDAERFQEAGQDMHSFFE